MKIRSVTATPVNIPLRAPYRFSYGSTASLTKTVIEVLTDDGVVGLGECADGDRAAEAFNVGFRFHSGETGIGSAAYLQVSAAVEAVRGASQTLLRWYGDDVIEGGPMVPKGGKLPLPVGAGLGVTLDRKALKRCHQRYLDEGAFPSGVAGLG